MTHPDPEHLSVLFIAHLEAGSSLAVGYGEAPEAASPAYPYLVVAPQGPFSMEGDLENPNITQNIEWEVASVGLTAQQAEGGLGSARDALLGTFINFTAASYAQTGGIKLEPTPADIESQRDKEPTLFIATDLFRVPVSSSV